MKDKKHTQIGFTLIEMLVVMAIIILLVAMVTPAITSALQRGRETKCFANLRSFGIAWNTNYLEVSSSPLSFGEDAIFPWLSAMYPRFISDNGMYICPSDTSRGAWGSKPAGPGESELFRTRDTNDFPETNDLGRNPEVPFVSYMYEFTEAPVTWNWQSYVLSSNKGSFATLSEVDTNGDGIASWREVKLQQLDYGDAWSQRPYERTQFPLVRCFHHYNDRLLQVRNTDDNIVERSFRVLNVAVNGNVFLSGLQWEYPIIP